MNFINRWENTIGAIIFMIAMLFVSACGTSSPPSDPLEEYSGDGFALNHGRTASSDGVWAEEYSLTIDGETFDLICFGTRGLDCHFLSEFHNGRENNEDAN
jgi:hypothetical protein